MRQFEAKRLPAEPDVTAPDGSGVRILASLDGGSMAHFELAPGRTSKAVRHCTVGELWFVLSGQGEMWRRHGEREEVTALEPGLSLTIPLGTEFQFRCLDDEPLAVVAVTMPPWPGDGEAVFVEGRWEPGPWEPGDR